MSIQPAILLIGPTGSGKTPLGDLLESEGVWGYRCAHFDFGAQLRQANADPLHFPALSEGDFRVIRNVLETGALLEDHQFPIAATMLRQFIRLKNMEESDYLILNGLPRHEGQAQAVSGLVQIKFGVLLECTPEVVLERIRLNTGGDRSNRSDDSLLEIRNKMEIYEKRILPLVDYYIINGITIEKVEVGVVTTPHGIHEHLTHIRYPF